MTFKTGFRKTVEAVSSRDFAHCENYKLQACVFSAHFFRLRYETVFTEAAGQESCVGTGEREPRPAALCPTSLTLLGVSPPSE